MVKWPYQFGADGAADAGASGMAVELLCIGEAMVEFNRPAEGADWRQGFGGDTSNTAIAAARLGTSTGYVSRVGGDGFGRMLLDLWAAEGVDTATVEVDADGQTGLYFVTHGVEGHQFEYRRAGSAASHMTAAGLPLAAIGAARVLHLSAISQAISETACEACFAAIEAARAAGVTISYDTNLRLKLWPLYRARPVIEATLRLADVVLPGLDDARTLMGFEEPDAICDGLLDRGAKVVALTMGADGVLVATPQTRACIAPHRVAAVDATGAGDAFDGAFLAEWLLTGDAVASARFANAAAALSVQGYGAVAPLPRRDAVESLLRTAESG
jgi:2-dehydro-3-deoxygluconokinase